MEIRKMSSRVSQAKTVDYISEPSENPIEKLMKISGSQGSSPRCTKKELLFLGVLGAPPGTRTLDPLIKSQLLYQLS